MGLDTRDHIITKLYEKCTPNKNNTGLEVCWFRVQVSSVRVVTILLGRPSYIIYLLEMCQEVKTPAVEGA